MLLGLAPLRAPRRRAPLFGLRRRAPPLPPRILGQTEGSERGGRAEADLTVLRWHAEVLRLAAK
eukprot:9651740-Alexandrium_andersonii.AAC.1